MKFCLYAKDWGIDELEFIDALDTKAEALALKRYYEANYPDDAYGYPCRYVVRREAAPEPAISWEQLAAAGMEA